MCSWGQAGEKATLTVIAQQKRKRESEESIRRKAKMKEILSIWLVTFLNVLLSYQVL